MEMRGCLGTYPILLDIMLGCQDHTFLYFFPIHSFAAFWGMKYIYDKKGVGIFVYFSVRFVYSSQVAITVQGEEIETLNDHDYFGQCSVLIGEKRLYTAKALTPCDILVLPGDEVKRIIEYDEKIRPVLEHGSVFRMIRIYNRCRLFSLDQSMLQRSHDPEEKLKTLFKVYLEDLAGQRNEII